MASVICGTATNLGLPALLPTPSPSKVYNALGIPVPVKKNTVRLIVRPSRDFSDPIEFWRFYKPYFNLI